MPENMCVFMLDRMKIIFGGKCHPSCSYLISWLNILPQLPIDFPPFHATIFPMRPPHFHFLLQWFSFSFLFFSCLSPLPAIYFGPLLTPAVEQRKNTLLSAIVMKKFVIKIQQQMRKAHTYTRRNGGGDGWFVKFSPWLLFLPFLPFIPFHVPNYGKASFFSEFSSRSSPCPRSHLIRWVRRKFETAHGLTGNRGWLNGIWE